MRAPADDAAAREALERFRHSGIRIDRDGRLWHEGAPIDHPNMLRAFRRWLDRLPAPDGRHVMRLDAERYVYVEVEGTPLVASSVRWDGDRAWLQLPDGEEEELDYRGVRLDPARGGAAYAPVRGGKLQARLTPQAWLQLAEHVIEAPGGALLEAHGQRWPISLR